MGSKQKTSIKLTDSGSIRWLDRFFVFNSTTNEIVGGSHDIDTAIKLASTLNNKNIVSASLERFKYVNKKLLEITDV